VRLDVEPDIHRLHRPRLVERENDEKVVAYVPTLWRTDFRRIIHPSSI
jgi:hypothetical protein